MYDIGDILHGFISTIHPPKAKFFLCVSKLQRLFFLINTENRKMYDCLSLSPEKYSFLKDKKRYLSCSNTFSIPDDILSKAKFIAKIEKEDLLRIVQKIKMSRRLPRQQKESLLKELLSIDETCYLLSNPDTATRLIKAIEEVNAGNVIPKDIKEFDV